MAIHIPTEDNASEAAIRLRDEMVKLQKNSSEIGKMVISYFLLRNDTISFRQMAKLVTIVKNLNLLFSSTGKELDKRLKEYT